MRLVQFRVACLLAISLTGIAQPKAQTLDSLLVNGGKKIGNNSYVAIPILFYGEETKWGFGASAGYYRIKEGVNKASNIQGTAIYTQRKQFQFGLYPKIYTSNRNFYYSGHLKFSYYPDRFWGIGNNTSDTLEENYTPRMFSILFQRQRVMFGTIMAGIQYQFAYSDIAKFDSEGKLENSGLNGTNAFRTSGLGFLLTWDNRDNNFYPLNGEFYKLSLLVNSKIFGSSLSYSRLTLDLRNFYSIVGQHSMALQVYTDFTWGDTPFQQMPSLGGNEILRGYYQGRYRDMLMLSGQLEYRFPIYKRLKGAMFGAMGQVSDDLSNLTFHGFRYSAGGGLRFKVSPAKVHLRFDVGITEKGDAALYFTASEAF